jgi:hypothetical protein
MRAFPSWFLRITCDRCGKDSMLNEAHMGQHRRGMAPRVLIGRMRHEGCGGRAARAELLTGIDGVSSRPVRRIVLRDGQAAESGRGRLSAFGRNRSRVG